MEKMIKKLKKKKIEKNELTKILLKINIFDRKLKRKF